MVKSHKRLIKDHLQESFTYFMLQVVDGKMNKGNDNGKMMNEMFLSEKNREIG